jgi:hypothetical protein
MTVLLMNNQYNAMNIMLFILEVSNMTAPLGNR